MTSRYRLYIDESGDHTYHNLQDPQKRYLGLTGCFLDQESIQNLQESFKILKSIHFPHKDQDDSLPLHRTSIIQRHGAFYVLKDKSKRTAFDNDLLDILQKTNFRIISVVIDKKNHVERYHEAAYHPYHYCLTVILERYAGYLQFRSAQGDVMAESRGGTEDMELKQTYQKIYHIGTRFRRSNFFQKVLTSREIKLKIKDKCIAGLELADILAFPLRRQVIIENGLQFPSSYATFSDKVCESIKSKFNRRGYSGRVDGYGKIFLK